MCPPQAPVQAPPPEVETQLLRRGVSTQGPPAGEWRVDVDTWPPDPKLRITGAQSIPSGPVRPPAPLTAAPSSILVFLLSSAPHSCRPCHFGQSPC